MKQRDQFASAEDSILLARISDALRNAEDRSRAGFVGFLDERQAALAARELRGKPNVRFWGGGEECERVLLGIFPEWQEPEDECFPLTAVTMRFRKEATIGHRDVLGSLMGLGVERDTVGDIRIGPGRAVVFVRREILPYFLTQITKIGREGVSVSEGVELPLPERAALLPIADTIASARLDCVVSSLVNASRSDAAQRIAAGLVMLNFAVCLSVSQEVAVGDKISVRGEGKFVVQQIGPLTRKQRLSFRAGKYQ